MGRKLGQHFLFDPGILDRIVDALEPEASDRVVEIGPGKGTLTERLARRVGEVVAIEKDPALARDLATGAWRSGAGKPTNVTIVEGDALALEWSELLPGSPANEPGSHKIVGNIPYAITSPLIDKALRAPLPRAIVFLVQKEVADRVVAVPGSAAYGGLSVGVQVAATADRMFVVKAGAFRPPPEVESAVIRLRPRGSPLLATGDGTGFRTFVTKLFGQRRKQIVRSLRTVCALEKSAAEAAVEAVGVQPVDRVEVLSPQTLVDLYGVVRSLTR